MTIRPAAALVQLDLNEPLPIEAAAGSDIVVRLRASCLAGRERRGMLAKLLMPDGSDVSHPFVTHDGSASETGDVFLKVPPRIGEHIWRFVLPAHELEGTQYDEAVLDVRVRGTPQVSSLAVWDVPSPVVAGIAFKIKVGAKSSAGCGLNGRGVEVLRDGMVVACGTLGDAPFPGTSALHWTELQLTAPQDAGVTSWSVRFQADGLELPHEGASTTFSAAIVPPPDHTLTVKVIEKDSAAPVEEASVRLGAYRAETGRAGFAKVRLPKGHYELSVWKAGYEIQPKTLELDRDASVEMEASLVPEEDPDARWKM